MGMYDQLKVSTDLLPITKAYKKRFEGHVWQTKDFECMLRTFYIPKEGNLCGCSPCYLQGRRSINFYTYLNNEEWWEFDALFKDGQLQSVEGGLREDD